MAVRKLQTHADVTKALAWIWRQVEADSMEIPKAKTLTYILATMAGVLSEHDLDARIKALEERSNTPRRK
jgi:hypothetical protein